MKWDEVFDKPVKEIIIEPQKPEEISPPVSEPNLYNIAMTARYGKSFYKDFIQTFEKIKEEANKTIS